MNSKTWVLMLIVVNMCFYCINKTDTEKHKTDTNKDQVLKKPTFNRIIKDYFVDSLYIHGKLEYTNCKSCHEYYGKSVSKIAMSEYSKNYNIFYNAIQKSSDSIYHASIKNLSSDQCQAIFYYMKIRYEPKY